MKEKIVIGAASFYKHAYFFNPEFAELPSDIKNEIKVICTCMAERIHGIFNMGFYDDGSVYFEAMGEESDVFYDESATQLEIAELTKERKELIRTLGMWYTVFRTPEGEDLINSVTKNIKSDISGESAVIINR